jgi:fatty-acyl-CoA synthase
MNRFWKLITRLYLRRYRVPRDLVRESFSRYADRTALITPSGELTFNELAQRVYALSHALEDAGLRKGDRFFTLLHDDREQIEARLAAFESGFVITSFHASHPLSLIQTAASIAKPKALIYDPATIPDLPAALAEKGLHPFTLSVGSGGTYESSLERTQPRRSTFNVDPDDPASLGFTSGTTGEPKALFTTHGVIVTSLKLTAMNVSVKPGQRDRFLLGIPLVGAGSGVVMPMLFSGAMQIIPPAYTADHLARLISKHEITRMFLTPSLLIDLLDHPEADLSSLRNVIYGTAPMPVPKLEEAILRWGPIFQQGYGMAEVLPPVSLLQMHQHVRGDSPAPRSVLRSVGKIVPEVRVKIIDDHGSVLPTGEVGEVLIKSPTTFSGYWQNEEMNARVLREGWYHSGDLGFIDTDGFLHILGRRHDMIKTSSGHVFPLLIEERAHDHPGVKEAALIPAETDAGLLLVVSPRRALHSPEKLAHLKQELAALYAQDTQIPIGPDQIKIMDELPRSYLVKVLRRDIRSSMSPSQSQ